MLRLLFVVLLAGLVGVASWYFLEKTYAYDAFASQTTRTSLEVTEEQSAELAASRLKSDMLAFGGFSALLCMLLGAVANPSSRLIRRLMAAIAGLPLGFAAGAAAGGVGNWFDAHVGFPNDPILYWFQRWFLMILPIGLMAGLVTALAGKLRAELMPALMGGALASVLAAIIYCLASGVLTPMEGHQEIYPGHSGNRLLALVLIGSCVAGAIAWFLTTAVTKKAGRLKANSASEV